MAVLKLVTQGIPRVTSFDTLVYEYILMIDNVSDIIKIN